jgi:HEAT repeat protein
MARTERARTRWPICVALAAALAAGQCSQDRFAQLSRRLDDPLRREEAIAGLLQLVQKASAKERPALRARTVDALMDAYREDESRPEIVGALAVLGDPRAAPVLVAALRDHERGGAYLETAARAARALGDLGLRDEVPALVEALRKAHRNPQVEHTSWLLRALIETLDRLGDRRALEVLVEVLRGDPARQDFYLNRLAARALGRLGDPRAIKPLVRSLSTASHGLLLYEESRRALCRIGPAASAELLAAAAGRHDRRDPLHADAAAALHLLGDLGERPVVARLAALARQKDPAELKLALAETRLRLGDAGGEQTLIDLVDGDGSLTSRRAAAELLGWYGSRDGCGDRLRAACAGKARADAAGRVLCWSVALSFARVAGPGAIADFDALHAMKIDAATRHYLATYRPRLEIVTSCADDLACHRRAALDAKRDWRSRERAALEVGRLAHAGGGTVIALELGGALATAHPQLRTAILVALERLGGSLDARTAVRLAALLDAAAAPPARATAAAAPATPPEADGAAPPAVTSRTLCLAERLRRIAAGREGVKR